MSTPYSLTTKKTWGQTFGDLDDVFRRWHVQVADYRVLYDTTAVRDGRKVVFTPEERRVEVDFKHPSGKPVHLESERQLRPVDNLRAIMLALDEMRMIETRGFADMIGSAYLQLNSGNGNEPASLAYPMSFEEACKVLFIDAGAPIAVIDRVYRELAKEAHADVGGSDQRMIQLNRAYEVLKKAHDAI